MENTQQENKPSVEELLKQATDYVAQTQPVIDSFTKANAEFTKQAQRTVGVLVDRGIITSGKEDAFVEKVSKDHTYMLRLCENMAKQLEPNNVGASAIDEDNVPKIAGANASVDPYEELFAPDLVSHNQTSQQL